MRRRVDPHRGAWLGRPNRSGRLVLAAQILLVVAVAVLVYTTRFGIDDLLYRDEAIYAYGGQQLVEGVPPYVSTSIRRRRSRPSCRSGCGRGQGLRRRRCLRDPGRILHPHPPDPGCGLRCRVVADRISAGGPQGAAAFVSFRGFAIDALVGRTPRRPASCSRSWPRRCCCNAGGSWAVLRSRWPSWCGNRSSSMRSLRSRSPGSLRSRRSPTQRGSDAGGAGDPRGGDHRLLRGGRTR